ncbi:hypothetical protein [Rhodovibrio salinarum]|uniref:Uncharacterized protein n=1 Tax=Rhodovibrio salinarum TaxID=1087 RepID=A0A934QIB3_9PROT|nr:hypothetical protein [Rhodovibrio salinarum]MBK1697308.1 hypothetical protein [Rhodovibrio salinarum]
MPTPCITVHSLAHAEVALRAAAEADVTVTLLSAPGAAAYAGPGWFVQLLEQARPGYEHALASAYLDCGPRPGDVLAAYRAGVAGVIFTGQTAVAEKLHALAQAHGAAFRTDRPDALDLLDVADPKSAVAAFLGSTVAHGR